MVVTINILVEYVTIKTSEMVRTKTKNSLGADSGDFINRTEILKHTQDRFNGSFNTSLYRIRTVSNMNIFTYEVFI